MPLFFFLPIPVQHRHGVKWFSRNAHWRRLIQWARPNDAPLPMRIQRTGPPAATSFIVATTSWKCAICPNTHIYIPRRTARSRAGPRGFQGKRGTEKKTITRYNNNQPTRTVSLIIMSRPRGHKSHGPGFGWLSPGERMKRAVQWVPPRGTNGN